MEDNKDILDNFKKQQKPEVPKGFFENFYDELMAKIAEDESGLTNFQKTTKPDVPADFFSNFAQNITTQTNKEEPIEQVKQPTRIINLKIVGVITAAAACLLVIFLLMPPKNTGNLAEDGLEPANKTASFSDEDLLAFVDENDIIDYILDEDIEIIDNSSEVETTNETPVENSGENFEGLNDEDILYYFEDDLDDINLDDLEL